MSRGRRGISAQVADGVPVLLYHKVGRCPAGVAVRSHYISPALFRAHLGFLKQNGYRTIALHDLVRYALGEPLAVERPVLITFDDGYDCVYHNALPALAEFGFGAAIFMLAGYVGGANDWEPKRPACLEPMLTAPHLVEMADAGMEIGSHGMGHARMTGLDDRSLRDELTRSKQMLEGLLGHEIGAVSYPFGAHDERVRAFAAEAGYVLGCTTERGVNQVGANPFALKRINIRRHNYVPLFARKLRRAHLVSRSRSQG